MSEYVSAVKARMYVSVAGKPARRRKGLTALISSRGAQARVLVPMTEQQQTLWEGANYVVALAALIGIGVVWN